MKKIFFDCGTRDVTASLGLLVLRLSFGLMMLFGHGIPKLQSFATMKDKFFVTSMWPFSHLSPPVSLMATIGAELVCSVLIVLGLSTRFAAFFLGFAMVVAAFDFAGSGTWFMTGAGLAKEPALLYLIPMLVLIITGAGATSFDAVIFKDTKRRRW
jgi:putative oxidoreductase